MTSTAASTSRFSINSYVGLGAGLGVPQSALEAVTSLDPKDYQYPTPSLAQRRTAMKQLEHAGVSSILYSSSLLDSHGSMTLEGNSSKMRGFDGHADYFLFLVAKKQLDASSCLFTRLAIQSICDLFAFSKSCCILSSN